jgi:hypothetical protein
MVTWVLNGQDGYLQTQPWAGRDLTEIATEATTSALKCSGDGLDNVIWACGMAPETAPSLPAVLGQRNQAP